MLKQLKKSLLGLLGSKKFMAATISGVAWIAGRFGADIDADELVYAVAPLWGYILAQMGADWKKAAAEIDAMKPEQLEEPKPE
ncbi:MAG: hypothetical protein KJO40_13665 [Deltaproteobacteria bacterium]|nr:hypothetical protein [Deltaproteobacteria bacterium]